MSNETDAPYPQVEKEWGIDTQISGIELTEDKKSVVDNLREILGPERFVFVKRKFTLDQDISKLYGLVWGQCTPSLKEGIIWLD